MYMPSVVHGVLYIALQIGTSLALYPDQAGVNDWHLKHIGSPLQTGFYRLPTDENDVSSDIKFKILPIVRTEKNYLAALRPSDGSIVWRRSPNSNETLLDAGFDEHVLWAVSKLRLHHYIRLYDPLKGHLLWEFRLGLPDVLPSVESCGGNVKLSEAAMFGTGLAWIYGEKKELNYITTRKLVTLSGGRLVVKYKVGASKPLWAWEPSESTVIISKILATKKGIYATGIESRTKKVVVYLLNAADGEVLENVVLDDAPPNPSMQFHHSVLDSAHNIFWGETTCQDSRASLQSISAVSFRGAGLGDAVHSQIALEASHLDEMHFVAGDSEAAFHLKGTVSATGLYSSSFSFDGEQLRLISSQALDARSLGVFAQHSGLFHISLGVVDATEDQTVLQIGTHDAGVQKVKLNLSRMRFGQVQAVSVAPLGPTDVAMVVTTEDYSMHMFSGALNELQHQWTREESLAYADRHAIIELPDSHLWTQADEPNLNGVVSQYIHRLRSNWAALVSFLTDDRLLSQRAADGIRVRDSLGLRKLVVFSTPNGKLMALDSLERGAIVWSRFIGRPIVKLMLLRSALVKLPPVLGVVTHQESSTGFDGETRLLRIDGFTGFDFVSSHLASEEVISGPRHEIMALPLVDPTESTQVLAFIDGDSVIISPSFPSAYSEMSRLPHQIFGLSFNASYLGGFHLVAREDKAFVQPIWQLGIPAQQLLAVVTPTPRHSASQGRVLNDRRVLYKYLNPHLILVASYSHGLSINLVDAISGSILHEAVHSNALKDHFQAVVTENTVVYHFWDDSEVKAYVTVVLELFESQFPDVRGETDQDHATFSRALPYVSSRSFVSEGMVSAVGVTVTRQGIANREFLFAITPGNHIAAIPSRILDALRPYSGMPRLSAVEGVMDYTPIVQLDPKAVLTYGQDVAGIANIVSSPTVYESTTIVFGYGLDVFWTSYAPSQQFDVLSPDFSKAALLTTVLALVIGILIAGPMLQEKKLREQWL